MSYGFLDIAVTPSVRAAQQQMGADEIWTDFRGHREFDRFSTQEASFHKTAGQLLYRDHVGDRVALYPASWRA